MNNKNIKKLPCGKSDYDVIVENNYYYIDKTKHIELIEDNANTYIFFLRPRRFGKSLLISTLANYYDINKKDRFDALFRNTYIGKNPTPLKNKYYILRFDFSEIGTKDELNIIEDRFNDNIYATIKRFFKIYQDFIEEKKEFEDYFPKAVSSPTLISTLLKLLEPKSVKLYVLIDEYDNFANNILMDKGEDDYKKITQSGGFVKDFFKAIKAGTNPAVIDRIFATGVSPLLLSDVTSGMNIGDNVSFDVNLNSLVGFNDLEIEEILEYYINANLVKREDKDEIKRIFKAYYNNYCFSKDYNKRVCNSNMVLYFLNSYIKNNGMPDELIDSSFSSDFKKLDFLVYEGKKFNDNYNELLDIIAYGSIREDLEKTFSLNRIKNTKAFISLFYYLGLLTITGKDKAMGQYIYEIPNNAVRSMDYEYIGNALNRAYDIEEGFDSRQNKLYFKMATEGEWEAPLRIILDIYYKYVPLRDGVLKEVALKLFCFSFLIRDKYHFATSEQELNRGYSDIYLEADMLFEKTTKYEYILEFKYITGGKEEVTDEKVKVAKEEAIKQLLSYENDRKVLKAKSVGKVVKKIVIVASSQKVELMEEV